MRVRGEWENLVFSVEKVGWEWAEMTIARVFAS